MNKITFLSIPVVMFVVTLLGWGYINQPSIEGSGDSVENVSQDDVTQTQDDNNKPDNNDGLPEVRFDATLPTLMRREYNGTNLELGEILAQNTDYTRYAITYNSDDLEISGIMNIPNGDGPFPLVVLNHGYIDPAIYTRGRGLKREQDYFARRGYAVIHPDYRKHAFSDEGPEIEDQARIGYTIDVINAVLAVRDADLDNVNAESVGMMGHSMGGGIAQNIAVAKPELVDAFVLYAPVSGDYYENFLEYIANDDDNGDDEREQRILETYGPPEENPDYWHDVSAKNFYDRIVAPTMVHIGTQDDSTPPDWSQDINDRLEAAGKDVTLHVYEGESHEFVPQWDVMMERSARFFDKYL